MAQQNEPFAASVATANRWLDAVADALETDDRTAAYRCLRAWFHTVRDRISIVGAAHLSAQMPELLRGMFFEGWVPSHVPVRHSREAFVAQFARTAGIPRGEVQVVAGFVTDALDALFSPGQLDRVFAVLPTSLVETIWGTEHVDEFDDDDIETVADAAPPHPSTDRLSAVETRLQALGHAVDVLTHRLDLIEPERSDKQ